MQTIRVIVADDDESIRNTLAAILETDERFEVVAEVPDGYALVDVVAQLRPDVVLLDVHMPGGGVAAARALLAGPPVVVVAVSGETSPRTVGDLVRAGVRGYLAKGRIGPGFPDLVARCHQGEVLLAVPTAAEAMRRLALEH
ncbi:response regulator [Nocardioides euryhalodurans]|nr:response regulator transcription factor [Nocardioides euryhalodurans]